MDPDNEVASKRRQIGLPRQAFCLLLSLSQSRRQTSIQPAHQKKDLDKRIASASVSCDRALLEDWISA
jgi:hypothetical protein